MKQAFCIFLLLVVAFGASAKDRLEPFVGEFQGTLEQRNAHEKNAQWVASPVALTGRWLVSNHYAELRGTFKLTGIARPIDLVFLWGWDPFQKEYRLVVLDDLVGLVDVFEQESSAPLTFTNVAHGTYFQDEHGRGYSRVIVEFPEDGAFRMQWASSRDGKEWRDYARVTFKRTAKVQP
jgi:hypothetical protein